MEDLKGKYITVTGATGGLGAEICKSFAKSGANLNLLVRNKGKCEKLVQKLKKLSPEIDVNVVITDFSSMESVKAAAEKLSQCKNDVVILNAGIYCEDTYVTDSGYNNIFQVNFLSQYYLLRKLLDNGAKIEKAVAVGSLAHRWARFDGNDIDYSGKGYNKVYGNSKRFLTFSFFDLADKYKDTEFCVAHPGVSPTALITHFKGFWGKVASFFVKILFPPPIRAKRSIVYGVRNGCGAFRWIGPWMFGIYGRPVKRKLSKTKDYEDIISVAGGIYKKVSEKF